MLKLIKSLGAIEILLFQIIFWAGIWLYDDYLGSLLTVIIVPIFFFILVVAVIADLIERSKVPKIYFVHLALTILVPILIAGYVYFAFEGTYDWVKNI